MMHFKKCDKLIKRESSPIVIYFLVVASFRLAVIMVGILGQGTHVRLVLAVRGRLVKGI